MDEDDMQQFSLRWHNHQSSVVCALSRMLSSGALTDVTLSAAGAHLRAHRLVLASCSQYFAQLFKEVEGESNALVVVVGCEPAELRLLLTFMYTGEVTAPRHALPALLRLARTLRVSGLTDADTNSSVTATEPESPKEEPPASPVNMELATTDSQLEKTYLCFDTDASPKDDQEGKETYAADLRSERDRLSKLDQIVQNLYSTHKLGPPAPPPLVPPLPSFTDDPFDRKYRTASSVCSVCNKRLSNQYNLRVHMETHAGRRHACRACSHVSRSRDALRKHVAYRHARADAPPRTDL